MIAAAVNVLVNSLVLAAIYALVGLGWVLIFRATKILNFATGNLMLLSGYVFFFFNNSTLHLPLIPAVAATLIVMMAVGSLTHLAVMRPLAGQPLFAPVIVTLGLAIVMSSLMSIIWGPANRSLAPVGTPALNVVLPGTPLTGYGAAAIVAAVVVIVAVDLFLSRARTGLQMRAVAESALLAAQGAMRIDLLYALAWGMAAVALGVVGITYSFAALLSPFSTALGMRGLTPAIMGGLDSVRGVVLGAIVVALVENLAVLRLGGDAADPIVFAMLLVMLLVRPTGFFGQKEVRRL